MKYTAFGVTYGVSYVVAADPAAAYQIVKDDLDKRGLGFRGDRVMEKVELLAETGESPDCGMTLYMCSYLPPGEQP